MSNTSIWPINRTLSGTTTLGQSRPGSDGNERVLCIPQSSSITGTSPSDCLLSYSRHLLVGVVLPLCRDAISECYSPSQLGWELVKCTPYKSAWELALFLETSIICHHFKKIENIEHENLQRKRSGLTLMGKMLCFYMITQGYIQQKSCRKNIGFGLVCSTLSTIIISSYT